MIRLEFDRREVRRVMMEILDRLADKLMERIRHEIHMADLIASGRLIRSIGKRRISDTEMEVGLTAKHAPIMNYGAEPHAPNYDELLEWVIGKKGETGDEARKAAWRIYWHIKKYGLEGRHYLDRAVIGLVRDLGGDV
ncbi:hypothetical protein DRN93_04415 [archaeon]|nr:MAG: hypothetical protein DRN93_04415 [archaeon]